MVNMIGGVVMKKRLYIYLMTMACVSFAIGGCGKDEKQASGILVEDINGNAVEGSGEIEVTSMAEETVNVGPDGESYDSSEAEIVEEKPDGVIGEVYDGPGPGDEAEEPTGPSSPEEEAIANGTAAAEIPIDGPGANDVSPTGDGPSPADDAMIEENPGNPFDAQEIDENAPMEAPEGAIAVEVPSFSATSVSGSSVVSKIGGYVSLGSGDVAPDGSKIWSGSNGSYSADIQADASGNVYAAFFTSSGDKTYLAACAGAFDSGAQAFVNANTDGSYEANGILFELEAQGEEMCSLRVTSKSYQSILGSPI